jgi:spore germination protein GerM
MKIVNRKDGIIYNRWILNILGVICMLVCAGICLSASIDMDTDKIIPEDVQNNLKNGESPDDFPVYVYFADVNNKFLIGEERSGVKPDDPVLFCRLIIEELIKGPLSNLTATLPPATKLRAAYITPDKTAYVDFTGEIATQHPGGIAAERMTIYSIINSLILNVSDVDEVKILIEGEEAETLAGHIDIRFPISAGMLLIR